MRHRRVHPASTEAPLRRLQIGPLSLPVTRRVSRYVQWLLSRWHPDQDNEDLIDTICDVELALILDLLERPDLPVRLLADLVHGVARTAPERPEQVTLVLLRNLGHPAPVVQYEARSGL